MSDLLRKRPHIVDIQALSDITGILHLVARDEDGVLWHFQESDGGSTFRAVELGKGAASVPAAVVGSDGVPILFAAGPGGDVVTNIYNSSGARWIGWASLGGRAVTDVAASMSPTGALTVVARCADGDLLAARQGTVGEPLTHWLSIADSVRGRPVMIHTADSGLMRMGTVPS